MDRLGVWEHQAMRVDPWCMSLRSSTSTKQYAKIWADAGAVTSVVGRFVARALLHSSAFAMEILE